MNDIIVKTQALKKYYYVGNHIVKAIDGIDFVVKKGEFVSIIGKSGSGKSTLLHMIIAHSSGITGIVKEISI